MKFLLVGINASYSHTCLAIRSIYEYIKKEGEASPSLQTCGFSLPLQTGSNAARNACSFVEFTINQPVGEILRGITQQKPDVILFATYIWNAEIIVKIIPDLKKILPSVRIGAGGPEFGYAASLYFEKLPMLDFIIKGEGEEACRKLFEELGKRNEELGSREGEVIEEDIICELSRLAFPYPELKGEQTEELKNYAENRIFYYESSRGCPFKCAYCMSSLDTRVRFMPLERVYQDLQIFLDAQVRLVKFVDRTYNLQPERYIAIWKYILQHHNGKTMFHFEIEAEFLTEEALSFLQTVPAGVMQFEIGVQSANKQTLKAINRSENIEKLAENIRRLPRTIHQHLDLIAGLPYENLESFGNSYDFVMSLHPDALQLGFLKVLHGTSMETYAKANGWQWMENPVYETFSTPYMTYSDMLFLKDIELLTDAYYNSGVFSKTMKFIERNVGYWNFFSYLANAARNDGTLNAARRESFWFEYLYKNLEKLPYKTYNSNLPKVLYDLLRYDFVIRGKKGGYPEWYKHNYNKEQHRKLLEENGGIKNARLDFAHSEYEVFNCDPNSLLPEKTTGDAVEMLIRY